MGKTFGFLIFLSFAVFLLGFISGYFFERSSIAYTSSRLDELKVSLENMQLQEMFIAGEQVDCRLMYSTMGKVSWDLYYMVDRLRVTSPETRDYYDLKRAADMMSLRAWIIARNVQEKCKSDIVPILLIYSGYCPECDYQGTVLERIKEKHQEVLVYAIDFGLHEEANELVKSAYNINSTPSMIINRTLYDKLSEEEIEEIICQSISC